MPLLTTLIPLLQVPSHQRPPLLSGQISDAIIDYINPPFTSPLSPETTPSCQARFQIHRDCKN